jgi:tyrosine-specific transport protein
MIMGTEIGAGVLALPILIVHVGVYIGSIILIFAWALMLYTALLCCEANDAIKGDGSFATMARIFLGKSGKAFMTIVFWITLSSIAMAYISAAGSTFKEMFSMSAWLTSTVFVVIFGICVIIGTKTVDYVNRVLLSLKLLAFLIAILMLFSALKILNLSTSGEVLSIVSSLPAIATAFILHNIIPTIRTYLDYDKKALRRVVIIGSLIPLILYILWVTAIIGNIPGHGPNSFEAIFAKGKTANVGDLLNLLSLNTNNKFIMHAINFVATISVTTSFLGTSISLYHFVKDAFGHNKSNPVTNFIVPSILTFVIPLLIVIIFPNIFILTLSFAGVGATILFVLIPILIMRILVRRNHDFSIMMLRNPVLLILAFILGLGIILIEIIFNLGSILKILHQNF